MLSRIKAVIRREYLERVRTKAFWISTILVPIFLGAVLIGAQGTLQEQLLILIDRRRPLLVLAGAALAFALAACPLLTWRWGMAGTITYLYLAAILRVGVLGYFLHNQRSWPNSPSTAAGASVVAP